MQSHPTYLSIVFFYDPKDSEENGGETSRQKKQQAMILCDKHFRQYPPMLGDYLHF